MSIFLDIINLIYKKKINKIRKKQSAIFFFRIVSTSLSSSSIYGEERNEIAIYLNTENEMAEREGKFDTRQAALNLSIIPRLLDRVDRENTRRFKWWPEIRATSLEI